MLVVIPKKKSRFFCLITAILMLDDDLILFGFALIVPSALCQPLVCVQPWFILPDHRLHSVALLPLQAAHNLKGEGGKVEGWRLRSRFSLALNLWTACKWSLQWGKIC